MIDVSLGFPTRARLLQSSDFDVVFKQNKFRVSTPGFLILTRKNDFTYSRLGMIINKRTIPTSVKRNLIKRIVREAFRHAQLGGLDTVVLARPPANNDTRKQLRENLTLLFYELERKVGNQ